MDMKGDYMESFGWDKEFELGIEEIDRQHQELFKRINNLMLSLYEGKGKDELKKMVDYLSSYIEEHFAYEKELLSRTDYPDWTKHNIEHNKFIDFFLSLEKEIKSHGIDNFLAIRVEKYIREWWDNHETLFDRKCVPYVKNATRPR